MLRAHAGAFRGLLLIADLVICAGVVALLVAVGGEDPAAPRTWVLGAASCLAWPILLHRRDLYTSQRRTRWAVFAARMAGSGVLVGLLLSALAFSLGAPVARGFPIACALVQSVSLCAVRVAGIALLRFLRRHGRNTRNAVIVGSGPRALHVQHSIARHPEWGLRVMAFLDRRDLPLSPEISSELLYPVKELSDLMRDEVVDEVIVAWPRSLFAELDEIVDVCSDAGVPLTVLSDLFGRALPPPRISYLDSHPALRFAPVHHSRVQLAFKRAADVVGAAAGLILVAPVALAATLAIRATSPGPILFRQSRCGLNGRQFQMLKFRTMAVDAEQRKDELSHLNEMEGPVFKIRHDPRVTSAGRVLRRWSLDEIPQLWNVLRGDMSLVGPRPPTPDEVEQYAVPERRRLSMRPGITCYWQVRGRNEICSFEEWVRLDLEYIDNWSLVEDAKVLALTLPAVVQGEGAS